MKPRIVWSAFSKRWLCFLDPELGYGGWGVVPSDAYEMWVGKNMHFPWFIHYYPQDDNPLGLKRSG